MTNYSYCVKFATGQDEIVRAGSEKEAVILAQAQQIQKGNMWENIISISVVD